MTEPRPVRRLSRKRRFVFGLVTVALASAVVLIGAEVFVRSVRPYYTPETVRRSSLQYDPAVLARHRVVPNQVIEDPSLHINAQGYKGPDFRVEKDPGTIRILFLGGSMVWTTDASDGEDWPALAGRELEARGFDQVEVMNAGVPGHASWDSLGRYYGELWMYQPDIVVICHAWNDLKLIKAAREGISLFRWLRPYRPSQNPHVTYQNALDRFLGETSQVYVRLRSRYYAWKIPFGSEGIVEETQLSEDFDPAALEQYRLNINLIADAVLHTGGRPVFLTQPTLAVADLPESDRDQIRYQYVGLSHEGLSEAFAECRDILLEIGEARGIAVIDAYSELSGQPEKFMDHVHVSAEGARDVARIVAEGLAPMLEAEDWRR